MDTLVLQGSPQTILRQCLGNIQAVPLQSSIHIPNIPHPIPIAIGIPVQTCDDMLLKMKNLLIKGLDFIKTGKKW
jgi:hypothetical protein